MPFVQKDKLKCICQECGKEFEIQPHRKKTAKYCSKECKYKVVSRAVKLIWSLEKKKRVVLTCHNELCKKPFIAPYYDRNKRKYCCIECYFQARRKQHKVEIIIVQKKQEEHKKRDIWKLNSI